MRYINIFLNNMKDFNKKCGSCKFFKWEVDGKHTCSKKVKTDITKDTQKCKNWRYFV